MAASTRFRATLIVGMLALALAVVPAPVSAHDPNCTAATHVGPVKVHLLCSGGSDDSECILSVNVMFVHVNLLCD